MKLVYCATIIAGLCCLILGFISSKTATVRPILLPPTQSACVDLDCWPITVDSQGNRQSFEKLSSLSYLTQVQRFSLTENVALRLVKIEKPRSALRFEGYARASGRFAFFFQAEGECLMASLGQLLGLTAWRLVDFDDGVDSLTQGQFADPQVTLLNDVTGQQLHLSQYQLACSNPPQAEFISPAGQPFNLAVGGDIYEEDAYTYQLLAIDIDKQFACVQQSCGAEVTFLNLTYVDAHF